MAKLPTAEQIFERLVNDEGLARVREDPLYRRLAQRDRELVVRLEIESAGNARDLADKLARAGAEESLREAVEKLVGEHLANFELEVEADKSEDALAEREQAEGPADGVAAARGTPYGPDVGEEELSRRYAAGDLDEADLPPDMVKRLSGRR